MKANNTTPRHENRQGKRQGVLEPLAHPPQKASVDPLLATRVSQANGRLKAGNVGLTIRVVNARFYLRGTLPPKPGVERRPHDQWIATQVLANIANLPAVERMARRIAVQIAEGKFDWWEWIRDTRGHPNPNEMTVRDWVFRFQQHYQNTHKDTEKSRATWAKDYYRVFKELPQDVKLTPELCIQLIAKTEPDTRTRHRFCHSLKALATFANVHLDVKPYDIKNKNKPINKRELPSEEEIAEWFWRITEQSPEWGFVYGLMAVYGLRPGEVWHIVPESLSTGNGLLKITGGKTGPREGIFPLYPQWREEWGLTSPTLPPKPKDAHNGNALAKNLKALGMPFQAYCLRHAWAGRAALFNIDVGTAAKMMGHSVAMHHNHYGHWYNESYQNKAFEMLLQKSDNPLPPSPSVHR